MAVKLCKRCVNPSSRPNIFFDEEGICPVCRFAEQNKKGKVDWRARDKEIRDIIQWGRRNTKSSYDCIVTVSGGKDSTRQALYARDKLKANPLLVSCVYPPEQIHERGAANLGNLISLGFDTLSVSLNPQVWKTLMRQGFLKHANWCKSTEMALYAIPIHVAIAYKIPLIFLGENPAWTIGEKHGRLDGDASKMRYCNTLEGGDPSGLMTEDMTRKDVHFYTYPPEDDVEYAKIRIIYLGYYIRDWSGHKNAEFSIAHGLEIRKEPPERIGDLWGFSALDEEFRIVNQMIKHVKFGFGHVNDQVCEAITHGLMGRKEGIELLKKFDGKCDHFYIERFCRYLGISEQKFWAVVESFRGKDIWRRAGDDKWELDIDFT
ncbi:MAG: N-acetyl sugar amidotransferase [Candidatus Omnitrophota bacterium]